MAHTPTKIYSASAPGSLMLLGEYAVLHGHSSLVAAIDKRISVTITPRTDDLITITSHLGYAETHRQTISLTSPFEYMWASFQHFQPLLMTGCDCVVTKEFDSHLGLGSSAAVTVATTAALWQWLKPGPYPTPDELLTITKEMVLAVQQRGSGSDLVASIHGGLLCYKLDPLTIKKLEATPPISAVYSGFKTTTKEALSRIKESTLANTPLFKTMDSLVQKAVHSIEEKNWEQFGQLITAGQGFMQKLKVNTPILDTLVTQCLNKFRMLGSKISGSGLGDCVISIGHLPPTAFPTSEQQAAAGVKQLSVKIGQEGVLFA